MKDVKEGGQSGGVTITKEIAFSLSVVCLFISMAVWLSARLENISVRLDQLEKRGSEPMQLILKTVNEVQAQLSILSSRLDEHMKSQKNGNGGPP